MKSPLRLVSVVATLGFALSLMSGAASAATLTNGFVTQTQLDALQAGETSAQVIQALGKPESTTAWLDGTRSLDYEITDSLEGLRHVYVEVDNSGKMLMVQEVAD